ncbi:PREDICTED: chitinase [Prunus dulcis]|uniref:PREDICTED: chitinase n=1 Tax=Prunus dulcis TaxID=3755 RepID=A0A5E4F284_PRUDU|nr:PREDICTED: chitinase [Prunus dulcis]
MQLSRKFLEQVAASSISSATLSCIMFKTTLRNVGKPSVLSPSVAKLSLSDQAFFPLAFVACTTSVAFTSLVIAAVPTLFAMGRYSS